MSDKQESTVSLAAPCRLTFVNLFEPRAFGKKGKESGQPKYSSNFDFATDSGDLKALKAKAVEVAKAKWPGRDLKELKFPFSIGNVLADKAKAKGRDCEFYRDKIVMASRSKYEPRLSVIEGGKLVDYDGEKRPAAKPKFWSGVMVLAQFNFVAYDGVGANPDGVTAYLNMVCSLNKGERVGGGATAAEVFKGYVGTMSNEDPTGGAGNEADDEIPF